MRIFTTTKVLILPTFSRTFSIKNFRWVKTQFSNWSKHKQRETPVNKRNLPVAALDLHWWVNNASVSTNQHSSVCGHTPIFRYFFREVCFSWGLKIRASGLEDTSRPSPSLLMSACKRARWQTLTLSATSHIPRSCRTPPDEFWWRGKRGWSRRSP